MMLWGRGFSWWQGIVMVIRNGDIKANYIWSNLFAIWAWYWRVTRKHGSKNSLNCSLCNGTPITDCWLLFILYIQKYKWGMGDVLLGIINFIHDQSKLVISEWFVCSNECRGQKLRQNWACLTRQRLSEWRAGPFCCPDRGFECLQFSRGRNSLGRLESLAILVVTHFRAC
jgi:hypothetical protein